MENDGLSIYGFEGGMCVFRGEIERRGLLSEIIPALVEGNRGASYDGQRGVLEPTMGIDVVALKGEGREGPGVELGGM